MPFASDHDIGKLVETMLRSNLFFSPVAYRRRVKSPVEFALGIVRGLEVLVNTEPLGHALAELGQNICHPPTAHGWAGGAAWINQATIIGRSNLAWDLLSASSVYGEKSDPGKVAQKHGHSSLREAGHFLRRSLSSGRREPGGTAIDPTTCRGSAPRCRSIEGTTRIGPRDRHPSRVPTGVIGITTQSLGAGQ